MQKYTAPKSSLKEGDFAILFLFQLQNSLNITNILRSTLTTTKRRSRAMRPAPVRPLGFHCWPFRSVTFERTLQHLLSLTDLDLS